MSAASADTAALFAANDTMALGAFAAAKARGLSVPADPSVIGSRTTSLGAGFPRFNAAVPPHYPSGTKRSHCKRSGRGGRMGP
ncbi:substrate-binding domain-containing protein [Arthrobacter sp. YAF34]|uniref:substrate-binding domain-containing protein n=1 Tax=Arthrobacter sp. YAF34 TaxID=3233083 RepID=UPI003F92CEEE